VAAHQRDDWPARGSVRTLSAALARDPGARVLADDRHADFLLWRAPELERQLLADVRFELLSHRQIELLAHFESHADPSRTAGATIVVLDPQTQRIANWRTPGWRQLYADATIAIFEHD